MDNNLKDPLLDSGNPPADAESPIVGQNHHQLPRQEQQYHQPVISTSSSEEISVLPASTSYPRDNATVSSFPQSTPAAESSVAQALPNHPTQQQSTSSQVLSMSQLLPSSLGNNNEEDDPNTGNLVNESYGNLSQVQLVVLFTSCVHMIFIRVMIHLGVIQNSMMHLRAGNFHQIIIWADLLRILVCLGIEFLVTEGDILTSLYTNFVPNWKDALKPAVPILLVMLQEFCMLVAIFYLPLGVAELSGAGTLIGAALLSSTSVLKYSYTRKQWICLVSAIFGFYISAPHHASFLGHDFETLVKGTSGLFGSIACGSIVIIYLERMLKQDLASQRSDPPPASLWIRSIQLSLFSVIARMVFQHSSRTSTTDRGGAAMISFYTPSLALSELLLLAILKFVTAVHEKLMSMFAVAASMLLNFWIFGFEVTNTWFLYIGAIILIASTWLFGSPVPEWVFSMQETIRARLGIYHRVAMQPPAANEMPT